MKNLVFKIIFFLESRRDYHRMVNNKEMEMEYDLIIKSIKKISNIN